MEKMKRLVIIASIIFLLGGVFLNSNFIEQKQDEAYAQLKEKYSVEEVPVTEIKEIQEEKEQVTEEQVKPEVKAETKPVAVENRTTENVIWDFLKGKGYTDIQTAAIIGNLYQESGLNSSKVEYGSGEGIGIVQWSFGRKQQLKDYCKSQGKDWTDLQCQLEFLAKELKSNQFYEPYRSKFNNPYSIDEATEAYCWGFERPNAKKAGMDYRKKMAWQAYYRNVDR